MKKGITLVNPDPKPKAKHRVLRVVFIVVFALFAIYTIIDFFSDDASVGYFTSIEGKQQYMEAYDEVMATMPVPSEVYDIDTSWGTVRVYEWINEKNSDASPILLLPGHSSGTPMWQVNLDGFAEQHTVYAVDALGDAGKSSQLVPLDTMDDVTGWIDEILEQLDIGKVHIVGHSFGGGYAANFAQAYPEHVQSLTLLEPAFALNYPPLSVLAWATVSSIDFIPDTWRDYGLAKMIGEDPSAVTAASDDPLARMITAAATYYVNSLPTPQTLTSEQLKNLNMPVYIAIAENSPLTGDKAATNAALIPQGIVKVWENTTHSLPMEVPDELAVELNRFWKDAENNNTN